jgi:hypothetical protein
MSNVKIVRLQNGEDIISIVEEIMDGQHLLTNPMSFEVTKRGDTSIIMLNFFLPVQLVKSNEVLMSIKDILFITTPSDDFIEYYENSVDSLKKMETENEFEDEVQEELNERIKSLMIQAFENMEIDPEGDSIH